MPSIPGNIISLPRLKFNNLQEKNNFLYLYMEPDQRFQPRCSYCGKPASPNRRHSREIRDLGCFKHRTIVQFQYRDVFCKDCGIVTEKLDFVLPYARVTIRLAEAVGKLCEHMTIAEVARYFGLDWKTVKEIDKYYIQQQLEELPLDQVKIIGMDEVARKKGHKYFTLIYDLEKKQLLRIVEGREEEAVAQFFEELGEQAKNIKAAAIDMWQAYINVVQKYCPQARIVYDKFHIINNYHKLIDKIRRREFRDAPKEEKELFKGKRFLLLKNKEELWGDGEERLQELLENNKNLNTVYLLKEQLQALWDNVTIPSFLSALRQWCALARESEIPELDKFATSLEKHSVGLLNYCFYPIHTGIIEAYNNTIGVVKRKARGFHDEEYFKIKIFQAINLKKNY